MGGKQEQEHLRGIVGPDEIEVGHYNFFSGPIPKPWAMGRGTALILAGDFLAMTAAACARPPEPPPIIEPATPSVTRTPDLQATIAALVKENEALKTAVPQKSPTAEPTRGPVTTQESVRRATPSTRPQPTEAPVSGEKKIVGNWLFTPVLFKEVPFPDTFRREGFKRFFVELAVQNTDPAYNHTGNLLDAVGFEIEEGGHKFPGKTSKGEDGNMSQVDSVGDFYMPQNLPFKLYTILEVPQNIGNNPKLLIVSRHGTRNVSFDLKRDFPTAGKGKEVFSYRYYTDSEGKRRELHKLGEPLPGAKPDSIIPLAAKIALECSSGVWDTHGEWKMGLQWRALNNSRRELTIFKTIFIVDDEGTIWSRWDRRDSGRGGYPTVGPGLTKNFIYKGSVSLFAKCVKGGEMPPLPKGLKLVVFTVPSGGGFTWAVYDIGTPPQEPPVFGGQVDAEKMFQAK